MRSSRNSAWKRVRVFENRSPYDQVMTFRSFQKISSSKQLNSNSKFEFQTSEWTGREISRPGPGRPGGRLCSRPTQDQVDHSVDLGVDLVAESTFEAGFTLMYLASYLSSFVDPPIYNQPLKLVSLHKILSDLMLL